MKHPASLQGVARGNPAISGRPMGPKAAQASCAAAVLSRVCEDISLSLAAPRAVIFGTHPHGFRDSFSALVLGAPFFSAPGFFAAEPGPARAGPDVPPQLSPKPDWVHPPGETPRSGRDRAYNLDTLFEAAPQDRAGQRERAGDRAAHLGDVDRVLGSDTCNLLMGRVKAGHSSRKISISPSSFSMR